MHKDTQNPCGLFQDQWEGPALLGMPNVEQLELLSVHCSIIELC